MRIHFEPGSDAGGGSADSLIAGGGDSAPPVDPPAEPSAGAPDAGTASPYHRGWYGDNGEFTSKDWTGKLPEELQRYAGTFGKYKSVNELLHGFGNSVQMATGKGLQPLPPDASDQLKQEFSDQMKRANGVPDDVAGYQIERPENMPEELWNQDRVSKFAEVMHKHHASPALVKELFDLNAEDTLSMAQDLQVQREAHVAQATQELRDEWGDEFEAKKIKARRGAATLGLDPDNDAVFEHPAFVKAMVRLTEDLVSEDRLVSGDSDPSMGQSDLEKAMDILQNANNPLHKAFHDPMHPQHEYAVQQRSMFNQRYAQKQQKS